MCSEACTESACLSDLLKLSLAPLLHAANGIACTLQNFRDPCEYPTQKCLRWLMRLADWSPQGHTAADTGGNENSWRQPGALIHAVSQISRFNSMQQEEVASLKDLVGQVCIVCLCVCVCTCMCVCVSICLFVPAFMSECESMPTLCAHLCT